MTIKPGECAFGEQPESLRGWHEEAAALEGVGAYSWMASRLYGVSRVLEVGCGSGNGTLAMVVEGMRVLAFEKEPSSVRRTLMTLRAHGVSAEATLSIDDAISHTADVVVVCADFLKSDHVGADYSSLDALVCWNAGSDVVPFGKRDGVCGSQAVLRDIEPLQRAVFCAAGRMSSGTVVHVVDRVSYQQHHRAQIEHAFSVRHALLAAPMVNIIPGLTSVWPYRTNEIMDEEQHRLRHFEPLKTVALVSTVGFVL